jgi:hypothetical protein
VRTALGRLFYAIGIRRAPDSGLVLTRRFGLLALGAIVVFLMGFGWFMHYTTTPEFCATCHFIKPYVQSWRESNHNMVNCLKCHYPPGVVSYMRGKLVGLSELIKTITKTHGAKPHAEVEDAACLREGCHETRLLEGKVAFKGKYPFDHSLHLTELRRGKKLRCTTCHSQIVQGSHMTVTESVCFTCHFKGHVHERTLDPVGNCTSCHDVPGEPIQVTDTRSFEHAPIVGRGVSCDKCHFDSIQGAGEVPRQVCLDCHGEPERLE